ncbi:MAG: diguanylate cyclase [Deltaproteobacteria bacterium]|nr:diguanylate cyclase [Deltaproteobacteria bacterium]
MTHLRRSLDVEKKAWRTFIISFSLIIAVIINGIFIGIFFRNRTLFQEEFLNRSRSYFQDIVLTRRWTASFGGVYVEKKDGVISNPYLKNPDIETVDGRTFTMKNPALVTREVSEMAERSGLYTYHITSLKPINPSNTADRFEREALKAFERGAKELSARVREDDGLEYFRYMAPLMTERSCLTCHAEQGYKLGDVRGGISVTFDISDTSRALVFNSIIIVILGGLILGFLLVFFYVSTSRVRSILASANEHIRKQAVTDELTGLSNRRQFFEVMGEEFQRAKRYRRNLSCIILDVDLFKRVNDTYGHQTGDRVLKEIAGVLRANLRKSDLPARYGGEEFVCILVETDQDGAETVAERTRVSIEALTIDTEKGELKVTSSFGVVSLSPEQLDQSEDPSQLVKLADEALYRAKENGRNRVELANFTATPAV